MQTLPETEPTSTPTVILTLQTSSTISTLPTPSSMYAVI